MEYNPFLAWKIFIKGLFYKYIAEVKSDSITVPFGANNEAVTDSSGKSLRPGVNALFEIRQPNYINGDDNTTVRNICHLGGNRQKF